MPEHVHLLISEPERGVHSLALQMLKQNVARELGLSEGSPFWQPRYYDFNVWSDAKRGIGSGAVFAHYANGAEGIVEIESQWTARRRELMGIFPTVVNSKRNP